MKSIFVYLYLYLTRLKIIVVSFIFLSSMIYSNLVFSQINWMWERQGGSRVTDMARSIATDLNGNSYITGYFSTDSAFFGNYYILGNPTWNGSSIFIAKINTDGDFIWARSAAGFNLQSFNNISYSISLNNSGELFITGFYIGPFVFGNTDTLNGKGVFIAKYDTAGNYKWVKNVVNNQPASILRTHAIVADSWGNCFITGESPDSLVFGNDTLIHGGTFISKLDSMGNFIWSKSFRSGIGKGLTFDSLSSHLFLTGQFNDSLFFNNTYYHGYGHSTDIFIAKFDTSGNDIWLKSAGGSGTDVGISISTDFNQNIYLTGQFSDTANFGNISMVSTNWTQDIFIAKYDSAGNILWARKGGGPNPGDAGYSICNNNIGDCFVTGAFERSANFSGNNISTNSNSRWGIFIVKYDTNGNLGWILTGGSSATSTTEGNSSYGISIDGNGKCYIAGVIDTSYYSVFGNDTIINPTYSCQAFIAKIGCDAQKPQITFQSGMLYSTPALSYQWYFNSVIMIAANSQTFTPVLTGNYSVMITDSNGCKILSDYFYFTDVGIYYNSQFSKAKIYPNPASDYIIINLDKYNNSYINTELYNSIGEKVLSTTEREFSINHLNNGIYFYKIMLSENEFSFGKLVKIK